MCEVGNDFSMVFSHSYSMEEETAQIVRIIKECFEEWVRSNLTESRINN